MVYTFSRFPSSNPELLEKWVTAAGRKDFAPTKNHFLCSDHFKDGDFLQGYNRNQLKHDTVPSIFRLSTSCKRVRRALTIYMLFIRTTFMRNTTRLKCGLECFAIFTAICDKQTSSPLLKKHSWHIFVKARGWLIVVKLLQCKRPQAG